jgi:four helix bundle protein
MKENIIQQKSFQFAVRIINLYKYLTNDKKEFVLSKQILRSGTSIGANIEESIGGQSERDFLSKLSISYKEARETIYWLKLLKETEYISKDEFESIHSEAEEICKILARIVITMKGKA